MTAGCVAKTIGEQIFPINQLSPVQQLRKFDTRILLNPQCRLLPLRVFSQVAESHIDSLINARHKKTGKMQWTREGADNVLQIRATLASNEWVTKATQPFHESNSLKFSVKIAIFFLSTKFRRLAWLCRQIRSEF